MPEFLNPDGSGLVGALNAAGVGQALQLDAGGNLKVSGAGSLGSLAAPNITEDQIRAWIANGQGFSVTNGKQTATGAINAGFSVFNPAASGKTLLVYSIKYMIGNNNFSTLNITTSDPAMGSSMTPINNKAGSSTTSVTSCSYANSNLTSAGTVNDAFGSASNTATQVLQNGDALIIPPGYGFALYLNLSGANAYVASAEWIEY
jgi:hypothetical protein